jgi:hypothetical protein
VYCGKTDPNPVYNIPLETLQAVKEDPKMPHKRSMTVSPMPNTNLQSQNLVTVLLVDVRNVLAYQLTFDVSKDPSAAERFIQAVGYANAVGKSRDAGKK